MEVVFICKTNLNNDGRILNQIKILEDYYKDTLRIDFILFSDKSLTIDLGENVHVHEIKTVFRNSSFLRLFTVLEFTCKAFFKLWQLKPKLVHVQDLAIVFPMYLYRLVRGNAFKLIYDDHEMPNENESLQYRIFQFFEVKLMKSADYVLFANRERMEVLKQLYDLKPRLAYFLNLPYFDDLEIVIKDNDYAKEVSVLRKRIDLGDRFIMHQGALEVERGRKKLANFSRKLPDRCFLMIVGVSQKSFEEFVVEYSLEKERFYWVGSVPYETLNEYWKLVEAAVVMYLPTYTNNRLCAPNRLYIAMNHQIPVIVNKDNPVLHNFMEQYKIGVYIENINSPVDIERLFEYNYTVDIMKQLKEEESKKLIAIYEDI